jgi:hypothetical protein
VTFPPVPTGITTRLAIVCPARKFRDDASGGVAPVGNTVSHPGEVGSVTVMFITTAVASAGTPPRPATCTSTTPPAPSGEVRLGFSA